MFIVVCLFMGERKRSMPIGSHPAQTSMPCKDQNSVPFTYPTIPPCLDLTETPPHSPNHTLPHPILLLTLARIRTRHPLLHPRLPLPAPLVRTRTGYTPPPRQEMAYAGYAMGLTPPVHSSRRTYL